MCEHWSEEDWENLERLLARLAVRQERRRKSGKMSDTGSLSEDSALSEGRLIIDEQPALEVEVKTSLPGKSPRVSSEARGRASGSERSPSGDRSGSARPSPARGSGKKKSSKGSSSSSRRAESGREGGGKHSSSSSSSSRKKSAPRPPHSLSEGSQGLLEALDDIRGESNSWRRLWLAEKFNPCPARPPYGRTYPLGPGILGVHPPNQKDLIDFFYCFNNVLHKLK